MRPKAKEMTASICGFLCQLIIGFISEVNQSPEVRAFIMTACQEFHLARGCSKLCISMRRDVACLEFGFALEMPNSARPRSGVVSTCQPRVRSTPKMTTEAGPHASSL